MASDCWHYVQCLAMSLLNSLLARGVLQKGMLCRLDNYVVSMVRDKPIIIMLEVTIVGGPVDWNSEAVPQP